MTPFDDAKTQLSPRSAAASAHTMDRRSFVAGTGATIGLVPFLMACMNPGHLHGEPSGDGVFMTPVEGGPTPTPAAVTGRTLVLIELAGGNDGLNTVVPFEDPTYRDMRPNLALDRDQVLSLRGKGLGLHPALAPLVPAWDAGELSIALGVGYPDPNRSHFRSIDIWEAASTATATPTGGNWVARHLSTRGAGPGVPVDALVVGGGGLGPVSGGSLRPLVVRRPADLEHGERKQRLLAANANAAAAAGNKSLAHVLRVSRETRAALGTVSKRAASAPRLDVTFPSGRFGQALEGVARLLGAGVAPPVVKLTLGGFDTHANQANKHRQLLAQLGGGLAAFRAALTKAGRWDQVLVMTYSEFGRRPRENGSRGTDHGTAAPHFILGGKVAGAFIGVQPSLTDLAGGDLRHSLDFRALYAGVVRDWWGADAGELARGRRVERFLRV